MLSAMRQFQDRGCGLRFFNPCLPIAAAAHFAGSQIDHPAAVAGFGHSQQRASAGLLDVIGMRRDCEQVYHRRSRR